MKLGSVTSATCGLKSALVLLVCAMALSALPNTVSASWGDADINSSSFSMIPFAPYNEIKVSSTDGGSTWTKIEPGLLKLHHSSHIDTAWPGFVGEYGIFLGECLGNSGNCSGLPRLYATSVDERDYAHSFIIDFDPTTIPMAPFGPRNNDYGREMLEECTERMAQSGGGNDLVYGHKMWVALSADTFKDLDGNYLPPHEVGPSGELVFTNGDFVRYYEMTVPVRCLAEDAPTREPTDDGTPVPNEDFVVQDVKLFLSTYSHAVTHPNDFTTCKKGRILIRVETNQAGPVEMWLWTAGVGPIQDEYIQAWSSHVGSGQYEAEVTRWVSVSETSVLQAMVEVNSGYVGLQAGWDDLVLKCISGVPDLTLGGDDVEGDSERDLGLRSN